MSNFDLFRARMRNEELCRQKFETSFITDGAAAIQIHILRLKLDRAASMVFTDVEGPDTAIVFTPKQQDKKNNLLKTDYYTWDDKMYFIYEDVVIARDVAYIKQKAYQCNVKVISLDEDGCCIPECGGYFISSLRSYKDSELQQKINISDKEEPILILPYQKWIRVGSKIEVGGKPWKVVDFDAITNPGIMYISLNRDFFKKGADMIEHTTMDYLPAGQECILQTQEGYFNSSSPLIIKSKTANEVKFEIPYGTEELVISIMQNGEIREQKYKVGL